MGGSLPVDAITLVLRTQMTCQNLLRGATIHVETIKVNKSQSLMKENPSRQDFGVCAGSQDGVFQGPADNPDVDDDVDQDDDDDGHNDCGVCAGPQDWFFQGPVEQILPALPAISSQEQVIGSQNCQNHKYLNVGDKFSESLIFLFHQDCSSIS